MRGRGQESQGTEVEREAGKRREGGVKEDRSIYERECDSRTDGKANEGTKNEVKKDRGPRKLKWQRRTNEG
jgi:hypothetical protein